MTPPTLDDNFRRLFQRCTPPPLSDDDLDRAFARFEGRRRPAPRHGRILAAAAAILLLGFLGWLGLSSPPLPAAPGAQEPGKKKESPEEIARWIADLGSASPEAREKAKERLLAVGEAALAPLDRALYHEDPEVRIQSQDLARTIRRRVEIQGSLAFVRAAIKIVRARWVARDFRDFEQCVRDAFDPEMPAFVHYVPRKTVDARFDGLGLQNYGWGGMSDTLTPALVAALDKDGLLFLAPSERILDLSRTCVFTLPDKTGWSAYVVVALPELAAPDALLQVIACATDEPLRFFLGARLAPQANGGVKIADVDPKSSGLAKAFRKGDVLRALNGGPLNSVRDLRAAVDAPVKQLTITTDRDGKVFSTQIKVLERVGLLRTGPKAESAAKEIFEEAERISSKDPLRAWDLYSQLLNEYSKTEFVSTAGKGVLQERVTALKESLRASDK